MEIQKTSALPNYDTMVQQSDDESQSSRQQVAVAALRSGLFFHSVIGLPLLIPGILRACDGANYDDTNFLDFGTFFLLSVGSAMTSGILGALLSYSNNRNEQANTCCTPKMLRGTLAASTVVAFIASISLLSQPKAYVPLFCAASSCFGIIIGDKVGSYIFEQGMQRQQNRLAP